MVIQQHQLSKKYRMKKKLSNLIILLTVFTRNIYIHLKTFKILNFESLPKIKNKEVIIINSFSIDYWIKFESIIANDLIKKGFFVIVVTKKNLYSKYSKYNFKSNQISIIFLDRFVRIFYPIKTFDINNLAVLKSFSHNGASVGKLVISSIKNFVLNEKAYFNLKQKIRINLLINLSLKYFYSYREIINIYKPKLIIATEKGDIGSGELFDIAIKNSIDFVQWSGCHQPQSIILKRYNKFNKGVHPFSVSNKSLNNFDFNNIDLNNEILNFFESGYVKGDWFSYKKLLDSKVMYTRISFCDEFSLDVSKKNVVIFSHVLNDANLFYGEDLFEGGFAEWLIETIKFIAKIDQVNWIVKMHPANVFRNKNLGITDNNLEVKLLLKEIGYIPKNILFIPPDSNINPYSFFDIADVGITVRGTIGAEMPCFGIPMVTAGTGRYSDLGFTIDPKTKEEYFEILKNVHLIDRIDESKINKAQKHAYLFFKSRVFGYHKIFKDNLGKSSLSENKIDIIDPDYSKSNIFKSLINFLINSQEEDYINTNF